MSCRWLLKAVLLMEAYWVTWNSRRQTSKKSKKAKVNVNLTLQTLLIRQSGPFKCFQAPTKNV